MGRMSENTCLISSYQSIITAACTNTGSKLKDSRPRAVERCSFVPRHSQVKLPLSWLFRRYDNWQPPDNYWWPLDNNRRPADDKSWSLDKMLGPLNDNLRSLDNMWRPLDNQWRPPDISRAKNESGGNQQKICYKNAAPNGFRTVWLPYYVNKNWSIFVLD